MRHSTVTAVVLKYEEPGWTDATLKCLLQSPYPVDVVVVDREGVGGLVEPFNAGALETKSDYIWFLTNVRFGPQLIPRLVRAMEDRSQCAALHPCFDSDHTHLRQIQATEKKIGKINRFVEKVPFIEWTAPFVRRSVWNEIGPLDPNMPYWGMDLDWSYRAQQAGYFPGVCLSVALDHLYLRHTVPVMAVTRDRQRIRAQHDAATEKALAEKWGKDWLKKLWPTHPHVAEGRETIYD